MLTASSLCRREKMPGSLVSAGASHFLERAQVKNQEEHHHKRIFREEFLALVRRHRIACDERYLWRRGSAVPSGSGLFRVRAPNVEIELVHSFGGCAPKATRASRRPTRPVRFSCNASTVARPTGVRPIISTPSGLQAKWSDHRCE